MSGLKEKALIIWCTAEQHAQIKRMAGAKGQTVATYLRELLNDGWRLRRQERAVHVASTPGEKARAVRCPKCRAEPGKACRTLTGNSAALSHSARYEMARQA